MLIFAAETIAMKQKLTEKEEMLMNIFWEHGTLFIRDLITYIPEPKPHYNTVATLVKFLEEKGFVEREPVANTFRYKVKVSEREYRGSSVGEMVARYYNNSYVSLVSQFVEEDKMDLQELKDLIATIEKNRK
jgi:predicted transcriptional regulator